MRLGAIFAVITVASAAVPACSGSVQLGGDANAADASGEEAGPRDDGSADASVAETGSGGQDASARDGETGDCDGTTCGTDGGDGGGNDSGGCQGTTPQCWGTDPIDEYVCCWHDPPGISASCVNGTWMCGSVPAPGCSTTPSCFDGGVLNICPSSAPPSGQACSYDGLQCGYDFGCVHCQCTSGAWSCNQLACSDSGAPQCPSPAPGGSCTEYQLACDYKSGGGCETCECAPSGFWSCVGMSCPPDGGP